MNPSYKKLLIAIDAISAKQPAIAGLLRNGLELAKIEPERWAKLLRDVNITLKNNGLTELKFTPQAVNDMIREVSRET